MPPNWGAVEAVAKSPRVLRAWLRGDGTFPNNERAPLLVYQGVLPVGTSRPEARGSELLTTNGWTSPWAWGVFTYHHYHSTAWEALLCVRGDAQIQFGGPSGPTLPATFGDLILIPPGVAHKQLQASGDFTLLGCYPEETPNADTCKGAPSKAQAQNIERCPVPRSDPVFGAAAQSWGDHFSALFEAPALEQAEAAAI